MSAGLEVCSMSNYEHMHDKVLHGYNPVRYQTVAWDVLTGTIFGRRTAKTLERAQEHTDKVVNDVLAKVPLGTDIKCAIFEIHSDAWIEKSHDVDWTES